MSMLEPCKLSGKEKVMGNVKIATSISVDNLCTIVPGVNVQKAKQDHFAEVLDIKESDTSKRIKEGFLHKRIMAFRLVTYISQTQTPADRICISIILWRLVNYSGT